MRKILFSIGNIDIPGYGFMIGLGFLVALFIGEYRAKKKDMKQEYVTDLALVAIICGFIGAKLLYIIVNFKEFMEAPLDVIGRSGFVVYGGIIAGVLCCMLYCHIKKISFLQYFDIIMPEVAVAQGFGRIGCFLAGCCYGRQTEHAWGVVFPQDSFAPAGVSLIPTQLISAAGDFIFAAILIIAADVILKGVAVNDGSGKFGHVAGDIGCMYLLLYGIGRFAVEFLRDDLRGAVGVLSTSQFISLFIVAGSLILYLWNRRKK